MSLGGRLEFGVRGSGRRAPYGKVTAWEHRHQPALYCEEAGRTKEQVECLAARECSAVRRMFGVAVMRSRGSHFHLSARRPDVGPV